MMNQDRIRMSGLLNKVCAAEDAAALITDGMTVGISGFTRFGDAKAVPRALVQRVRAGERLSVTLMTGASIGSNLDEDLSDAGITARRLPYQGSATLRGHINRGEVMYMDQHLSHTGEYIRHGHMRKPDVAVLDATCIDEGGIVCTTSVGNNALWATTADKVIVEINETHPMDMYGLHDIYTPGDHPGRGPLPIVHPGDRIGSPAIAVPADKIAAIVIHQMGDTPITLEPADEETQAIAGHLIEFLGHEVKKGRLTNSLRPLQSGVGAVANAVFRGFADSPFHGLSMYTEVAQDAVFDLIESGRMDAISTTAFSVTRPYMRIFDNIREFHGKVVLRPQEISNNPEVIRRLGLIACNTALEFDIYGNVNSTHVGGTKMMNGIGGSGDFARNAAYTIFVTKSHARNGTISSVVPMVSHHDHTEHDVDILVTEQGLADLRGLAPRERPAVIIDNTAHPAFRDMLRDYYKEALALGGHTPHVLGRAFFMHERFARTGTMLP